MSTVDTVRPLFQAEAIAAHQRGAALGSPLHLVPTWMRWSGRAVVLTVLTLVGLAATVPIDDVLRGTAVIRMDGREPVSAHVGGAIVELAVRPGQQVAPGDVLARLDDAPQRAELARHVHEHELVLARLLRAPHDDGLREQLAVLAAATELARARVDERTVVAPRGGRISDVRVRVGQQVAAGDALLAVEGPEALPVVVAMIPGHERPRLGTGPIELALELDGFPRMRVPVTVRSIADEAIGADEALRFLGAGQAGAIELSGAVVIVEASAASPEFVAEHQRYRFYDGMHGALEIAVGQHTLLATVLPELLEGTR